MQPGKRVAAGEIGDGAVLRITDYVCSAVAGKQRMVISGMLFLELASDKNGDFG